MLEELVSLEDGQEVDRLVEEAQGRRASSQVPNPLFASICNTRSYAALRVADLDWIVRPGYNSGGFILGKTH